MRKIGWSSSFPWWVKKVNFDAIIRFPAYQAQRGIEAATGGLL